jgi:hypothetical protein
MLGLPAAGRPGDAQSGAITKWLYRDPHALSKMAQGEGFRSLAAIVLRLR